MQLPPPVHGASVMNRCIKSSKKINSLYKCDYINLTTAGTIESINNFNIKKIFKTLIIYLKVLGRICNQRYDCAYITLSPIGFAFVKDSVIVLLLKIFKIPVFIHLHGKGIINIKKNNTLLYYYYKLIFSDINLILLSKKLLYDCKHVIGKKSKLHFLPNGIENNAITIPKRKDEPIRILYLSSMDPRKGYLNTAIAGESILNMDHNVEFVFAGNWNKNKKAKKKFLDILKKNKSIKYYGPVYGRKKESLFNAADIFVFPTKYPNECFPLVCLEALKYGLPVVSTKEGAITDIIKNNKNGILIDNNSPVEIAKALLVLITNKPLRIKMQDESRLRFRSNFTLDIFIKNFINILNLELYGN